MILPECALFVEICFKLVLILRRRFQKVGRKKGKNAKSAKDEEKGATSTVTSTHQPREGRRNDVKGFVCLRGWCRLETMCVCVCGVVFHYLSVWFIISPYDCDETIVVIFFIIALKSSHKYNKVKQISK